MPNPNDDKSNYELLTLSLSVVDHINAMVAYWDENEICRFANRAYQDWFGKTRDELLGTSMRDLLGPIYELNLPFIRGALKGQAQTFERSIPKPSGTGVRESLAMYTPHITDGVVRGFFVQVSDVSTLRERERALAQVIAQRDHAIGEIRTLRGLLNVCASCKNIRDEAGEWKPIESYVAARTHAQFSHGLCQTCLDDLYPDFADPPINTDPQST